MLAALPIVLVLALMIGLRWSAARAGIFGLALALLLAWNVYGLGRHTLPGLGPAGAAVGALAEALFTALTILWIVFPALCIHELQSRTGALDVLRAAMGRISGDPRILALLVAWFFVLFIEGAAGFGTPVALAAPFLVGAGFGRVTAVSIALIGHAVGVSFGAVGTPIIPQAAASGLAPQAIAAETATYHALLGWMMPLIVMFLAARTLPGGVREKPLWGWALTAALCFLLPYTLLAFLVGPELPTLGGALLGAALFIGLQRLFAGRGRQAGDAADAAALARAAAPYLVLIALVLATRLVPPLQQSLRAVELTWRHADFGGSMQILYHPGTLLLASFALGAFWQRATAAQVGAALAAVAQRLMPVTLALVAMLGLSRVMVHAGMIDALAVAAAGAAAGSWPLFAPAIGALGTFVTGSATASNILFTEFQVATAQHLGLPVLPLVGAQGFGAAVGNIICPHNVIAAGATVHLVGREGEVLRRTFVPALVYVSAGGALAMWLFR